MPSDPTPQISRVHIEGFKSYISRQTIEFSPLTLFFGSNASGKSSVLQALRWLGINARPADTGSELKGVAHGLDLGNFRNLVSGHNEDGLVTIEIEVDGEERTGQPKFRVKWIIEKGSPDSAGRITQLSVVDQFESGFVATLSGSEPRAVSGNGRDSHDVQVMDSGDLLERRQDLTVGFRGIRLLHLGNDGIIEEYIRMYQSIVTALSRFQFVGPHREQLPRVILSSKDRNLNNPLGITQSGTEDWTRLVTRLSQNGRNLDKINFYLSQLDIPYQMRFVQVPLEGLPSIALSTQPLIPYFVDADTGVEVFAGDIGYGVSQVLPVVVAAVMARPSGQHTMVEQPELHLHPRVQSRLADLLFYPTENGNQVSVETHSEHLIYRVQRLIREKLKTPDDVSVNYVERTRSGSIVHNLRLSENGNFIDAWPGGFFDERIENLI